MKSKENTTKIIKSKIEVKMFFRIVVSPKTGPIYKCHPYIFEVMVMTQLEKMTKGMYCI
jgi:hypothetical protein